jgi:hypothetical protein
MQNTRTFSWLATLSDASGNDFSYSLDDILRLSAFVDLILSGRVFDVYPKGVAFYPHVGCFVIDPGFNVDASSLYMSQVIFALNSP